MLRAAGRQFQITCLESALSLIFLHLQVGSTKANSKLVDVRSYVVKQIHSRQVYLKGIVYHQAGETRKGAGTEGLLKLSLLWTSLS